MFIKEAIVKKLPNGKYRLYSHKGKNLGTFDSREKAMKHEREVRFFKTQGAEISQIDMGKKVEMEHKQTIVDLAKMLKPDLDESELNEIVQQTVTEIAKDHISELPLYYTKLSDMEASSGKEATMSESIDSVGGDESNRSFTTTGVPAASLTYKEPYPVASPVEIGENISGSLKDTKEFDGDEIKEVSLNPWLMPENEETK